MKWIYILMIVFLMSCTAEPTQTEPANENVDSTAPSFVEDEQSEVEQTPTSPIDVNDDANVPAKVVQSKATHSDEVSELIRKAESHESYQVRYLSRVRDEYGNLAERLSFTQYYKDGKYHLEFSEVEKRGGYFYTDAYIFKESTFVECNKGGTSCKDFWQQSIEVDLDFETVDIISIVRNVPLNAKVTGEVTINNRKTKVVEYGGDTKLYIESYYGLPVKMEVYNGDELQRQDTYFLMDVGSVKDDKVSLTH